MEKIDLRQGSVRTIDSLAFPLHLRRARARKGGRFERLKAVIQRRLMTNLQTVDSQSPR